MRAWMLSFGAVAVACLVGSRLLFEQGLLGSPGGEVFAHAWVQWWHGLALPDWPAGPGDLLTSGRQWAVIDPLPTAFAGAVGRIFGVTAGYNSWIILSIALAFVGGAVLAWRIGGDPWTGGTVLAMAPPFLGSLTSGLTEDGAIGLAAIALAFVGDRDWRVGLLGGVSLGLLGWCGLVLAWYAALGAVIVGIGALLRDRRAFPGLVAGALAAAALVAPVAWFQGSRLSGEGHSYGELAERFEPLWRLNPWGGIDLLSLVLPGPVDAGDALVRFHPGYLGLSVLTLLGLGIVRQWGPVRPPKARWLFLLGTALLIAPGLHLRAAGHPLGIPNPFADAAMMLPFGHLLNHLGRALLIAVVALAALASLGAARLGKWAPAAAVIVAVDVLTFAPIEVPLTVTNDSPPGAVTAGLDDLSPGAVLVIPIAGPGVHFQRPLLDQRFHVRPLRLNPNRPGLDTRSDTERWLAGLAFPTPPPAPETFERPRDVAVLLVEQPYVKPVAEVLGEPDVRAKDSAAWDLVAREAAEPADGVSSPP